MPVQHTTAVVEFDKDSMPSCAHDCMWYEPESENESCLNRSSFICHKYRAEVFGTNREPGGVG